MPLHIEKIDNYFSSLNYVKDDFIELKKKVLALSYNAHGSLSELIQQNINLADIVISRIESVKSNASIVTLSKEFYAAFLADVRTDLLTLEAYFDSLQIAYSQRSDLHLTPFLMAVDGCLKSFCIDIGETSHFIPFISDTCVIKFPNKELCIPRSIKYNVMDLSFLAHELSHEIHSQISMNLQIVFGAFQNVRHEFSRRYGISVNALDEFLKLKTNLNSFYKDLQTYLLENDLVLSNLFSLFIIPRNDETSQEFVERFKQVRDDLPDVITNINYHYDLLVSSVEKHQINPCWIEEIIADLIAIRVVGPVYLRSLVKFFNPESINYDFSNPHPPNTFRIYYLYIQLKEMGFEKIGTKLWNEWHEGLAEKFQKLFLLYKSYIDELTLLIKKELDKCTINDFNLKDYKKSTKLAKQILSGKMIDDKASIILNASFLANQSGDMKKNNELVLKSLSQCL